ncbi:MAG: hypothetical protein ABL953_08450 [Ilumatobacteraceae bacterium]
MKGFGVLVLILALALLAPRESSGSRAFDASIGWRSTPLNRTQVPTLASGAHHARSGKRGDGELPSRKYTVARIGVGLLAAAVGIFMISR